jgi:hypothetical protein
MAHAAAMLLQIDTLDQLYLLTVVIYLELPNHMLEEARNGFPIVCGDIRGSCATTMNIACSQVGPDSGQDWLTT